MHRDLKPENVLLTADGHAKVADFGIAKALGQVQMTELRTAAGHVVGTPAYMAPEQVMGGEITPQTDLYATGLIAYELLAGRHPYDGVDAPMALMLRHANDEPPPLGRAARGPPAGRRRVGPRDAREGSRRPPRLRRPRVGLAGGRAWPTSWARAGAARRRCPRPASRRATCPS